jgi:broad specificity phosphatase PhoE
LRLLLLRHGTTKAVKEQRFQGLLDYPLSAEGIEEAKLLAKRLVEEKIDNIYCSPLQRARQTALPIAESHCLPLLILKQLREFSWGIMEGRRREDIEREFPAMAQALKKRGMRRTTVPGREPYRYLRGRIRSALQEIIRKGTKQSTNVIVSHGLFLNAFLVEFLGLDFAQSWPFVFEPASLTVVEIDGLGRHRLRLFNDTCHLCK